MLSKRTCLPAAASRITLAILAGLTVVTSPGGNALLAQTWFGPPLVASCPFSGQGFADLFHGFYVSGYPGTNLSLVTLGYSTTTPGLFSISLTARRNAFDGPMIGVTQTATVHVPAPPAEILVTFDFGGAPVTPGDTVAFTQTGSELSSDNNSFGSLFYDAGRGSCNSSIFETEGTLPPLDTVAGAGVGVAIYQRSSPAGPTACVASDTVLCVDDSPGDGRFKVHASFQTAQGGGRSGKGQAIPLSQLGVVHGGLLWFFSGDTPEMLFKIVNGCAVNGHYWAFLSAATDVGFTVTVDDTLRPDSKTYSNADRTAAPPVQDTSALASCGPCTTNADCRSPLLCCSTPILTKACLAPTPGGTCPLLP
ncbi:MAG TPA: hypothetical protein VJA16_11965 [Thermoanaerobaculia bacterium]